jgi:hypothetical protein
LSFTFSNFELQELFSEMDYEKFAADLQNNSEWVRVEACNLNEIEVKNDKRFIPLILDVPMLCIERSTLDIKTMRG